MLLHRQGFFLNFRLAFETELMAQADYGFWLVLVQIFLVSPLMIRQLSIFQKSGLTLDVPSVSALRTTSNHRDLIHSA